MVQLFKHKKFASYNRLLLIILLAIYAFPAASQSFASLGQEPPVQEQTKTSLKEALSELEARYNIVLAYKEKTVVNQLVNEEHWRKQSDFEKSIQLLLAPFDLVYKKVGEKTYVIKSKSKPAQQSMGQEAAGEHNIISQQPAINLPLQSLSPQNIEIKGKVTAQDNNEPLPGVTVLVKGTTIGTSTNGEGIYTLSVPEANASGTLVFSYIGYVSQEVAINNRSAIDISMVPDVQSLSEVVVVGYGTQERRNVTGAISSIKSDEITKLPVTGLQQAMQGRASGVQITQNSGTPGAGVSVIIRGPGTINNSDPLYVVDGIPITGSTNDINPNDIESIEVLKDASSTALYGSRGANGVVLITTKSGKSGKLQLNFDSYYGMQQVLNRVELLNAQEWAMIQNEGYENDNIPLVSRNPDINNGRAFGDSTNWLNEIFQLAPRQSYYLSANGGTEKSQFAVSGGYFNQEGIIPNSKYERYTLKVSVTNQLLPKFKLGNNLMLSYSNQRGHATNQDYGGILGEAMQISPLIPVRRQDGAYAGFIEETFYDRYRNPVAAINLRDQLNKDYRLLGNVFGEYNILKDLVFRTDFGLDFGISDDYNFNPSYAEDNNISLNNSLNRGYNNNATWNWENNIRYSATLGEVHDFSILAGVAAQSFHGEGINATRLNFINEAGYARYLNAGGLGEGEVFNGGDANEWSLFSVLGIVTYSYKSKYLFKGNIRRDGSSKFKGQNQFGIFPGFSAGWRISEEPFMKNIAFISDLKLRAGWGQIGNERSAGNYPTYALVDRDSYYVTGNPQMLVTGAGPRAYNNLDLRWETSEAIDVGLDMGLFDNKLTFTANYFDKRTKDMILSVALPTAGRGDLAPPATNAGEVRNRGVELEAAYRKSTGNFTYSIGANITTVQNRIVSLGETEGGYRVGGNILPSYIGLTTRTEVGRRMGDFYGYLTEGLFQTAEEITEANAIDGDPKTPYQVARTSPGDIRFKDISGPNGVPDGRITDADRTYLGKALPDFTYGFTANMGYKGFDLSLFIQGSQGNDILNATTLYQEFIYRSNNASKEILGRWTGPGTSNYIPRITTSDPNRNTRFSDRYIEDGSYVRLKNVQLGYSLPESLISAARLRSLRVYISAENLLTLTKYSGFDPEVGSSNNTARGIDRGIYPYSKTYLIGLNLGF